MSGGARPLQALLPAPWPALRRALTLAMTLPLALTLHAPVAGAAGTGLDRPQALAALQHREPLQRAAAVSRLGAIGRMEDAQSVAARLHDEDPAVRLRAGTALWQIWSRSGDAETDRLLASGVELMQRGEFAAARERFDAVVRRRPGFAEGWNKRATVRFLLGEDEASLRDCDEVLKRNPLHYGALSGMAQIHLRRDNPAAALRAFERALQINPNLDGGADFLELLREAVRQRGGQTT